MEIDKLKEIFQKETENHRLIVLKDDGVYRHIRLKEPGTGNCYFDLTTWPGHLAITGDVADYVFYRTDDMFTFFRNDELKINPRYWHEKMVSDSRVSPAKEFNYESWQEDVERQVKEYIEEHKEELQELDDSHQESKEDVLRDEIDNLLCEDSNDVRCHDAQCNFESEVCNIDLYDCEWDYHQYTHHFIWCLYAIVWGIQEYDKLKESA